jgi:pimeloyl-ACP methyl ester carboxylesterase
VRVDETTIEIAGEPVFFASAPTPDSATAPVLYLHGIPTSSDDWTPFLERTGGLAPDLPGFGRTSKGGHLQYTIESQADFVERFLADQDVDHVKLVAHDWGAVPGLVLAGRAPQRIERLVLINAVPLFAGFRWPRTVRLLRTPLIGELAMGATTRNVLARLLRQGTVDPAGWSEPRIAAVHRQFDQGTQRAILRLSRNASEQRLASAEGALTTITAPTLILWGEHDPWLPPDLANEYGRKLPHATIERRPDAGHWPWLDHPELIDRVAQFLA